MATHPLTLLSVLLVLLASTGISAQTNVTSTNSTNATDISLSCQDPGQPCCTSVVGSYCAGDGVGCSTTNNTCYATSDDTCEAVIGQQVCCEEVGSPCVDPGLACCNGTCTLAPATSYSAVNDYFFTVVATTASPSLFSVSDTNNSAYQSRLATFWTPYGFTGFTFLNRAIPGLFAINAYCMRDAQDVFLVFRGTDSLTGWIADDFNFLDIMPNPTNFGNATVGANSGFIRAYQAIVSDIYLCIRTLSAQINNATANVTANATANANPPASATEASATGSSSAGTVNATAAGGPRLWITGHSLGAALTEIAAADITANAIAPVAGVYSTGTPKVGDSAWGQLYSSLGLDNITWRLVHQGDPVAQAPPANFPLISDQYVSVGKEVDLVNSTTGNYCVYPGYSYNCTNSGVLGDVLGSFCTNLTDITQHYLSYYLAYTHQCALAALGNVTCPAAQNVSTPSIPSNVSGPLNNSGGVTFALPPLLLLLVAGLIHVAAVLVANV